MNDIFEGINGEDEHFDITICNPHFIDHQEPRAGTLRKLRSLTHKM
ncbi:MAG: RlmF-related methyltransferase [Bacteroidetes bacterium]|nr:RlmF-related methyltransferase [Bacteroidota bacterium]